MNCVSCGSGLSKGLRICPRCGSRVAALASPSTRTTTSPTGTAKPVGLQAPHQIQLAGFWPRCGAFAIDLAILLPMVFVATALMPLFSGLMVWWLYFAFFESSGWQCTPGKRLLRIKVTDVNGVRIRFGRASTRFVGKLLSAALLFAGFAMAAFTLNKQALHDLLANTLVLRT